MVRKHFTLCLVAVIAGCSGGSHLRQDIDSPEWETRSAAAGNLKAGRLNETSALLVLRLLDDPVPHVRERAAHVLAHHLRNGSAGNFFEHARDASDPARIAVAGVVAGRHYHESADEFLFDMIREPSAEMQLAAAMALGWSSNPRKREKLVELWRNAPDQNLRIVALVSASYPAEDAREDKQLLQCWIELVGEQPELLRNPYTLQAVGGMRIEGAGPHLLKLAADAQLRYLAIESLGKMRYNDAVPLLLEMLERDESWVLTRQVCRALGQIRAPEAGPVLARLFAESRPEAGRDAWDRATFIALAMNSIGGDDVFEAFVSQLTNKHKRSLALACLHEMTGTRLIARDNYWLYTWEGIQARWRQWWQDNREQVAERLAQQAEE